MSNINVWSVEEDLSDDAQEEDTVKVPVINKGDSACKRFETDSETLLAVKHIIELLDSIDNGEVVVITKDVW